METHATPVAQRRTVNIDTAMPHIGYHYTSKRNWEGIQKTGFVPYLITKRELDPIVPPPIFGVWVWRRELVDEAELGSILYQVSTKQSTDIVKLQIQYHMSDVLCAFDGTPITLSHDGNIGDYVYHIAEPAYILINPVPPERVALVKEFNLLKMIKNI